MSDKIHKELSLEELHQIAGIYHDWRSKKSSYRDLPGLCKTVTAEELAKHKWSFVPGRYVGFDRTRKTTLDMDKIRDEIELVEERLAETHLVSETLLTTLRGMFNG